MPDTDKPTAPPPAGSWTGPILFTLGAIAFNVGLAFVDYRLPLLVSGPFLMLLAVLDALLRAFGKSSAKPPASQKTT